MVTHNRQCPTLGLKLCSDVVAALNEATREQILGIWSIVRFLRKVAFKAMFCCYSYPTPVPQAQARIIATSRNSDSTCQAKGNTCAPHTLETMIAGFRTISSLDCNRSEFATTAISWLSWFEGWCVCFEWKCGRTNMRYACTL